MFLYYFSVHIEQGKKEQKGDRNAITKRYLCFHVAKA